VLDIPEAEGVVGDALAKLVRSHEKGQVILPAAVRKPLGFTGNSVMPRSPFGTCCELVGERECFVHRVL
jgi:hypothetical protein